ncbi:MAG: hypothetical protein NTZ09_20555, partial [Candidatus Hydrogenedentes bacterium]|nr:hypothetical protein [Candidatus Hydrogenedentota bacterium]
MVRTWILVALVLGALGCATGKPAPEREPAAALEAPAPQTTNPRPDITLNLDATTLLGDFVSTLADTTGGSLIVMNRLEYVSIPPRNWRKTPFEQVIKDIAGPANIQVEENPYYLFLYFPGYEVLESVSLEGRLDPAFAATTASIGFGYRTTIFEALAFMSSSLGITLLADQVVGDAQLGALNLAESPLHVCLAALLKSARVPADAFGVESTPEYVFLHAKANPPRETLLNPLELTPAQTEFLNPKVTATLMEPYYTPGAPLRPYLGRCMRGEDGHELPTGEWNTVEIMAVGDRSLHLLNGRVVNVLQDAECTTDGKT